MVFSAALCGAHPWEPGGYFPPVLAFIFSHSREEFYLFICPKLALLPFYLIGAAGELRGLWVNLGGNRLQSGGFLGKGKVRIGVEGDYIVFF